MQRNDTEKLSLQPCRPPFWARGGHAQTIWGHLLPSEKGPTPTETFWRLPLPDGDLLTATVFERAGEGVVYVFHGLGGDSEADYMRRTAHVITRLGHTAVLVNHRDCGHGQGLAKGIYHSGSGDDLSEVIRQGKLRFPNKTHLAVGFSLSGSALLNLLTGRVGTTLPDAAIVVNAPLDLISATRALTRGFNRIYDLRFSINLRRQVKAKHGKKYCFPRLATVVEFDEIYTSRLAGFKDSRDYYEQCSTLRNLPRIEVPTLLLTAKDDPFVPFESYQEAELSTSTFLHAEEVGGHMGYLSSQLTPWGTRRWLDYALSEAIPKWLSLGASPR